MQTPTRARRNAAHAAAKTRSRSRTFTGCRTCRSRHMKCDEAKPVCSACRRLGLACMGYEARLHWEMDRAGRHGTRGSAFRFPLFSEDARHSMGVELVRSVGNQDALDIILRLDAASPAGLHSHCAGPFSVFRVFDDPTSPASTAAAAGASAAAAASAPRGPSSPASSPDICLDSIYVAPACPFDAAADASWQPSDGCFWQTPVPLLDLHDPTPCLLTPHISNTDGVAEEELRVDLPPDLAAGAPAVPHEIALAALLEKAPVPQLTSVPQPAGPSIPVHAGPLLRYYRDRVLGPPSWGNAKRTSPWQTCLLPCALETLEDIVLWNSATHTRYSILYSLLSNSAFHMHVSAKTPASPWRSIAIDYQASAKAHLKRALQTELGSTDQNTYSEILMAILALAMASVFHDSRLVKTFLLDAERFIRLRGLCEKKTFKMRVLHHMYTHLRVFNESLDVALDTSTQPQAPIHCASEQKVELRKFCVSGECIKIEYDPTRLKSHDLGYNDIHLEIAGVWVHTMYHDIYGIPESLMTLLARTISLANERSKQDALGNKEGEVAAALTRHVKVLERNLWSWTCQIGAPKPEAPPPCTATSCRQVTTIDNTDTNKWFNLPPARAMASALHQAIILYFYRRLYNMSALLLQDSVRKVFEYLEPCWQVSSEGQDFSVPVAWSCFIASCEAAGPELQDRGRKCLDRIDNRGLSFTADIPSKVVYAIWEKRERTQDWSLSWPQMIGA